MIQLEKRIGIDSTPAMKALIKYTLRLFGFELKRTVGEETQERPFVPFRAEFDLFGKATPFWIYNPDAEWWYEPRGIMEHAEMGALRDFARKSERILEVGTHHGLTALLLAKHAKNGGQVLSVEAFPESALVAQAQVALNCLGHQLTVLNYACSDRTGEKVFLSNEHNSRVLPKQAQGVVAVETITVDELDCRYGPFDFLKIDVEGHEREVLRGAADMLKRRPRLAIELHLDLWKHRSLTADDVLGPIGLEHYAGKMEVRPDYGRLVDFDPAKLPGEGIVNIFLEPRA